MRFIAIVLQSARLCGLALLCTFIAAAAYGQAKAPAAVQAAFKAQFATANEAKYEREGKDWEVNFLQEGTKSSAVFSAAGALKETEMTITEAMVPTGAAAAFAKEHPGAKVNAWAKITPVTGQPRYEVEYRHKGKDKELLYTAEGQTIESED